MAAVGIKVSQWITYHGLALNVTTDLRPFYQIVPCGIKDRHVGSIKGLLCNVNESEAENRDHIKDHQLIDLTSKSLVHEFSEVFQVDLHHMQNMPVPVGISKGNTMENIQNMFQ